MVNKNYSIEQPPPILTTFQSNNNNNNDKKKIARISTTKNTIDPYHQMVFNNSSEPISQCTTGHHHHVQPKNLTINEIGRFQYILQMDREMATHRQSQSTIDSSNQFDSINIWKTDTTNNNLKFFSWCRQNLKHSIWPIIFLISCILLGCLIFFLFIGSSFSGKKQISDNNFLPSDFSEHISRKSNLKILPEIIDDNIYIQNNDNPEYPTTEEFLLDYKTTTTTKVKENKQDPNVLRSTVDNSNKKNSTQIRLILKPSNNDWIKTTTKNAAQKTMLKSISSSTEDTIHQLMENQENLFSDHQKHSTISTTTTESIIVKVSPTIPNSITKSTTEYEKQKNVDLGYCVSASLGICQGILQYDLTTIKSHRNLDSIELEHFQYLFASKCSKRSAEFVCSALEPECLPNGTLKPCKRICKSILEPCASIIASSEVLTTIFDCDQYPDSNDGNVCEDPTRRGKCNTDEFSCSDSTCIPKQWKCDNIKDCAQGEDEEDCIFCDHEEFQCKTTIDCIPEKYICDDYTDCPDGSDEDDCYQTDDENNTEIDYSRIYSFATIMAPESPLPQNKTIFSIFDYDNGENITETIIKETVTSDTNDYDDMQKGEASGRVVVKIPTNLSNFQESKEVMMTSDSENDFKYSPLNRTSTSTETVPTLCPDDQLRCVSGKCITVDQLCDKITDCPDGADEAMCVYKN